MSPGEVLDFCAKDIILKLADWMIVASGDAAYDTKNVSPSKRPFFVSQEAH